MSDDRLRNWARGYQRLMLGGLGVHAHTVCVDDFADDEGEYPYITAADVLGLLDRAAIAEAKVARVEALTDRWSDDLTRPRSMHRFAAANSIRAALTPVPTDDDGIDA